MSKVVKFLFNNPLAGLIPKAIGSIFGGKKQTDQGLTEAQQAQQRQLYATQEDNARLQGEQAASGRRLRGLGRRSLAFQGSELGVAPQLGG